MFGEPSASYRRPDDRHEHVVSRTDSYPGRYVSEWTGWDWLPTATRHGTPTVATEPGRMAVPAGQTPTATAECVCGRVCVCQVPVSVVRSVASFVAEWHPSAVFDGSPSAERAEDVTPCRCGQTFCGYRIFGRTMRRAGAYVRA